jgi:hypothetical protein
MSESELSKDQVETMFSNDSPVFSVISKKIRNRKKKLNKVVQKIMDHHKDKSKKVDPEDEKKQHNLEEEIKELEDMRQNIKEESQKVLRSYKTSMLAQPVDDKNVDSIISNSLGRVADALLINLLQNKFNVNDVLGDNEREGLRAVLVPLEQIMNPSANSIVYDRARDCFVEIFKSLAWGSEDIIPGSNVTFRHLVEQIDLIPGNVKNSEHSLHQPKTQTATVVSVTTDEPAAHASAPVEEVKKASKKAAKKAPVQEEDKEPTIEQLAEEDAQREQVDFKATTIASKQFIDEDGFIQVKPHARPAHEHDHLKKKFRDNRQARKNHTERYHVRGGKPIRGRGGRGHTDKHDLTDKGGKDKRAHGNDKRGKGEVRVVEASTE